MILIRPTMMVQSSMLSAMEEVVDFGEVLTAYRSSFLESGLISNVNWRFSEMVGAGWRRKYRVREEANEVGQARNFESFGGHFKLIRVT